MCCKSLIDVLLFVECVNVSMYTPLPESTFYLKVAGITLNVHMGRESQGLPNSVSGCML